MIKVVHIVKESFTNGWKNSYIVGNVVIRGSYYKCIQEGSRSYFL